MEEQSNATKADVIERVCNRIQKILNNTYEPQVLVPLGDMIILISAARMKVEQLRAFIKD